MKKFRKCIRTGFRKLKLFPHFTFVKLNDKTSFFNNASFEADVFNDQFRI